MDSAGYREACGCYINILWGPQTKIRDIVLFREIFINL